MAVKLEDRKAIIDILDQTPAIPEICQWCIFLRNHDELTLEMVTEIERDYMYDNYAADKSCASTWAFAAACSHDGKRPEADRADEWIAAVPCRARRLFIMATKSAWGTTYISGRPEWVCARQCSGTGDGTAGFPRPIRSGCIRR